MENSFKIYYDDFTMNYDSYNEKEKKAIQAMLNLRSNYNMEQRSHSKDIDALEETYDKYLDKMENDEFNKIIDDTENSVLIDASYALEDYLLELLNYYEDKL